MITAQDISAFALHKQHEFPASGIADAAVAWSSKISQRINKLMGWRDMGEECHFSPWRITDLIARRHITNTIWIPQKI
jgi:hypothetical protein